MLLNKRIPPIYILKKVKTDLFSVLIVSLLVLFLTEKYKHILPEIPLAIPAFLGTAISVLLSFKLSQSYDRWWEARKIWGSIVNDSRSLIIQLSSLTNDGADQIIKKVALRQIAWCYSLGQSLRGLNALDNIDSFVSSNEIKEIKTHNNKPLALLHLHASDIKTLRKNNLIDAFSQVQLDNTLVRLCDAQGKAERIKTTVFPLTYRIVLHAIIYLFVIILSISLVDIEGFYEIPLLLFISAAFFLLEKSATHMQDPFENRPTDTAVTTIARNIEINLKQLIQHEDCPSPLEPETFYQL